MIPEKFRVLDGSVLKIIACITMLIDHFAAAILFNVCIKPYAPVLPHDVWRLYEFYRILRYIGRTAFPIFCFFLTEGFVYTRSRKKYALRLLAAGLVSEIPFDLALYGTPFYPEHQNVMFELLLALLMLMSWDAIGSTPFFEKHIRSANATAAVRILCQAAAAAGFILAAERLNLDYGWRGLALILLLYLTRTVPLLQLIAGAVFFVPYELWCFPAFVLLFFYSRKRGRQHKYFFYAFYPGHLAILAAIAALLSH